MSVVDLFVRDATVLTMNASFDVLHHHDVAVKGQFIFAVTPTGGEAPEAKKVIDGRGLILMPGLINAHTHLGMSFFKGTAAAAELFEWLNWTGRYQKKMRPEDAYWSVMLAAAEMIRAGVTTVADMYLPDRQRRGHRRCWAAGLFGRRHHGAARRGRQGSGGRTD